MYYTNAVTPNRTAFTLIELLVVVAIVLVLTSLLLVGVGMVRQSVRRSKTTGLIQGITAAMELYALEDGRKRFPEARPDQSLRSSSNTGGEPLVLDMLRDRGALWRNDDLDAAPGSSAADRLVDAWKRPVRYTVDKVIDKNIDRPAPSRTDWNPKSREPFGYVWSLGRPSGDDAADALPANADRWIFHGSGN